MKQCLQDFTHKLMPQLTYSKNHTWLNYIGHNAAPIFRIQLLQDKTLKPGEKSYDLQPLFEKKKQLFSFKQLHSLFYMCMGLLTIPTFNVPANNYNSSHQRSQILLLILSTMTNPSPFLYSEFGKSEVERKGGEGKNFYILHGLVKKFRE